MRRRLLVLSRDVSLRATLARWLAPAGFGIELAESAKKAHEILATFEIAAGILRIERRDATILPVASELRQAGSRLIIVVDEGETGARLLRLGLAADGYLREPLARHAVLERVNAVLPPGGARENAAGGVPSIRVDGMTLDFSGHSLTDARGREVKLTRGEFAVLAALARRPGQVLSRDRLLDAVSGRRADAFDRSIDNLVARLRRKIERDAKQPRLVITVPGAGYKLSRPRSPDEPPPSLAAVPRFTILALPFASLGGPEIAHFAGSVSAMLSVQLRHVIGGAVVGQNAAPTAAAGAASAQEVGQRLGARYVLRGSVRRRGDCVRVNAQMTDARTARQIWADSCDGGVADLFAFESEVTARIARAIDLALVEVENECCRDWPGGPDLMDLVTRGYSYLNRPRSAGNLCRARDCFEAALRLDGRCSEAIAGLAQTHISDALNLWSANPAGQVRLADGLATRAIEVNPRSAYAYFVKGLLMKAQIRHEQSLAAFDQAVQLNPSLAPAHAEIGFARHILGRRESSMAHAYDGVARARRISPQEPVLANWLYGLGAAHVQAGENAPGMQLLNESIGLNPLPPALACLAAAFALIGDDEQARSILGDFRRTWPQETLQTYAMRSLANRHVFPRSRVYEGLRRAGLPER
jgi:DNA-binding response OmpR family regulator/TolB-like protein